MPAAKLPGTRKFHKGDRIGVTLRGADLDAGELSVKLEDLRRSKNTFEHLDKVDDLILREGTERKRVTAEVVESDQSGITVEVRTGQQAFVPADELGVSSEISVGLKIPVLVSADVKSEQLRASITRAGLIKTLRTFYDRMLQERERIEADYARVSDRVHSAYALLKAYTLYTRNVDYVIAEDEDGRRQVVIVDERTGRLMRGRRWSDGLHQAVEAKEAAQGVQVGQEMQTLATITLQSFFRGYDNLAGMTGTAVSQEEEFREVYELDVEPVPTHEPIRRIDMDDLVFRTRNDKVAALVDEIERLHSRRQPVLVGTVSVLFSEMLSKLLKSRSIPHNVLNAREHEREAEIVRGAGRLGAVTIATNMAGRGTDIKLGEGVVRCKRCCILCKDRNCGSCENEDAHDRSEECLEDVPCGLRIVGSERHESQRIDRQLRGRSGRQGDPGASQFLISIEDNLMRLFGSDRIGKLMDAAGFKEGEVIRHPMITNAVDRAQKRVETNQMEARKRLMKSDSYISAQRDHIYGIRRRFLESSDVSDLVQEQIETVVDALVAEHADPSEEPAEWDLIGLNEAFRSIFMVDVDFSDTDIDTLSLDELADSLQRAAEAAHERHAEHLNAIAEGAGSDFTSRDAERIASLRAIDAHWADYLQAIDDLRQNLVYSGFGSQNPEFEYGMQARKLFNEELLVELPKDALRLFFRLKPAPGQAPADRGATAPRRAYQPPAPDAAQQQDAEPKGGPVGSSPGARAAKGQARPFGAPRREQAPRKEQAPPGETVRKTKKPGRNDPCPCGSGKKYKKCCGRK
jgi:preprotein translocase subunit SecA